MNALHEHAELLLNVMNVFIMEPLLDWSKPAKGGVSYPLVSTRFAGTAHDSNDVYDGSSSSSS